jgi:hypothetical protein
MSALPPKADMGNGVTRQRTPIYVGASESRKSPVLEITFPVSSSEIPCSDAQGISSKALSFRLIKGRERIEWTDFRQISLYFSLLQGIWLRRLVRYGLRRQPASAENWPGVRTLLIVVGPVAGSRDSLNPNRTFYCRRNRPFAVLFHRPISYAIRF